MYWVMFKTANHWFADSDSKGNQEFTLRQAKKIVAELRARLNLTARDKFVIKIVKIPEEDDN